MKFYNRTEELRLIREAMERDYCFFVITGRRRVGKTRLIREALRGKDHLELFIPRKRATLALDQVSSMISDQTGYSPRFSDMRDMVQYILTLDKVVFIDEISNLQHVDPGAFSDLQEFIDREKEKRNVCLLVDGSYVGIMKKVFQSRKEPLFGRATNNLELKPLNVVHSIKMLMDGSLSFKDSLEAYSIFGGIPRYLELIREYPSMEDIIRDVFSPGSIFLTEGENLLIQEFGASWDTYFSIMEVISRGKYGPTSIANQLGMEVQMLPKYLETLRELGLIERMRPIFGKPRHVHYCIADPFFQSWFRLCYPNLGLLKDGRVRVSSENFRSEIGGGMERVVQDLLFAADSLPFQPDEIGSWWDRSGNEVDILLYSKKDKKIAAGEVKWRERLVGIDVVKRLMSNLDMIDWHNGRRKEFPFIISKSGFTDAAMRLIRENGIFAFGLKEIEEALTKSIPLEWKKEEE